MPSFNRATLIGNLGRDPEVRYLPDGTPVATISLATTENWKDKETGELHEATEWHRVVFFRGLANVVGEYLKKGGLIHVEGKLTTRKWTDKDGVDRYSTDIHARDLLMLGGPKVPPGERHTDDKGGADAVPI